MEHNETVTLVILISYFNIFCFLVSAVAVWLLFGWLIYYSWVTKISVWLLTGYCSLAAWLPQLLCGFCNFSLATFWLQHLWKHSKRYPNTLTHKVYLQQTFPTPGKRNHLSCSEGVVFVKHHQGYQPRSYSHSLHNTFSLRNPPIVLCKELLERTISEVEWNGMS